MSSLISLTAQIGLLCSQSLSSIIHPYRFNVCSTARIVASHNKYRYNAMESVVLMLLCEDSTTFGIAPQ